MCGRSTAGIAVQSRQYALRAASLTLRQDVTWAMSSAGLTTRSASVVRLLLIHKMLAVQALNVMALVGSCLCSRYISGLDCTLSK